nr:histone deacetylase 14 [Tanacetum cinerariifolium]
EKSQSNPIYKIAVDLLKNTNFFRAFTSSSTIPSIYIQQFWDTILYDKKVGCYKCQLDEQWFDLAKETLKEALQITSVNHNQAFAAHPSIYGLIDFVNQLGYPKLVMNFSNVVTNDLFQPWRRKHRFHPRPDSPLHLSNKEPVLGYLKFSAMGTKSEVFEMPIPDSLITTEIQQATYYREYLTKVTHHKKYLADEDANYQKTLEESMKDAYALPKGPLPPVVIREPESRKYQPLPEVPRKGKAKVTEEQVAHDLLS